MSSPRRPHFVDSRSASPVRWRVVEVDAAQSRARLSPYVDLRDLTRRLDDAFGVDGWGNRYRPFGADAVGCELEIGGVVKSVVAHGAPAHADPSELAAAALTETAKLHGVELPVDPGVEAWVEYDAEERQPLYWPDQAEAQGSIPHAADSSALEAADAADAPSSQPLGTPPEDTGQPPISTEGQRAIDRLIDRLREAGYGLEAAKLVTAHKGYGNDPEAARELYARLRQLLFAEGSS